MFLFCSSTDLSRICDDHIASSPISGLELQKETASLLVWGDRFKK